MRVMVLVKANEESEAGVMPTSDELNEMGKFNDELVKAGIMLAADGLSSSAQGKRVRFDTKGGSTVIDGPFAETKELVAGFWVWEVASLEEAVEWLKRSPFRDTEVEIRRVSELADFGEAFTPEMQAKEQALRDQVAAKQK
ncbi:MAG: dehydrogenase [Jatrophihabitans sp.]|jgi:hypothetical protein|nr:dehydrogenase [Jatrophihabitans sp.]